jgi:hypothetical protein
MILAIINDLVLNRLSGRKFPIDPEPNSKILESSCHYERHNYACQNESVDMKDISLLRKVAVAFLLFSLDFLFPEQEIRGILCCYS